MQARYARFVLKVLGQPHLGKISRGRCFSAAMRSWRPCRRAFPKRLKQDLQIPKAQRRAPAASLRAIENRCRTAMRPSRKRIRRVRILINSLRRISACISRRWGGGKARGRKNLPGIITTRCVSQGAHRERAAHPHAKQNPSICEVFGQLLLQKPHQCLSFASTCAQLKEMELRTHRAPTMSPWIPPPWLQWPP